MIGKQRTHMESLGALAKAPRPILVGVTLVAAFLIVSIATSIAHAASLETRPGAIPAAERFRDLNISDHVPSHLPGWISQESLSLQLSPSQHFGGDPEDEAWWEAFGTHRLGNTALSAVVFEGDLVVGGDFTDASGKSAFHIARWTGASWEPIGPGFDDAVFDLAVADDRLIAAGLFNLAGTDTVSHIAEWNGIEWSALGEGLDDAILSVTAIGEQIYAGGYFDHSGANETQLNGIAEWDGSAWNPLGTGVGGNPGGSPAHVNVVEEWNGDLVIGGTFSQANGESVQNLARWDGSTFVSIGGSPNERVYSIATKEADLYIGGLFSRIGSVSARAIGRYDGTEWSALGDGFNSSVLSILPQDEQVFAGGLFTTVDDTTTAVSVAAFNTEAAPLVWSSLHSEMDGGIAELVQWGDRVIAVGIFLNAGGETVNYIAQWDGQSWGALGSSLNGDVLAILANAPCDDCDLVAAGTFTKAGGVRANRVARWSRRDKQDPLSWRWSGMGSGFNGSIYSLTEFQGELYAGGAFTFSDTLAAGGLARWDGTEWVPTGEELEGAVYDATVWQDRLVLGGTLYRIGGKVISTQVASWDGESFAAVGTTLNGAVNAVEVFHGGLFIGGAFTRSSLDPVPGIGELVDDIWTSVGGGVNAEVRDVESYNDKLYVGGSFTQVDTFDTSFLTRWDGASFSSDLDTLNSPVESLFAGEDFLHVGGNFTLETATGPTQAIALYSSRAGWFRLGTGTDGLVSASAELEGDIYVGGAFATAGAVDSRGIARYEGGIPVPVRLAYFTAARHPNNVTIEWKVSAAHDHAGFHLYRGNTSPDARITPLLIQTPGKDNAYLFSDPNAPHGAAFYWLEEVSLNGESVFYGPVEAAPGEIGPHSLVSHFGMGPNPFRQDVWLSFDLAEESTFSGAIYDVLGRNVGLFQSQTLGAGNHRIAWNGLSSSGDPASSGVYFASLRFQPTGTNSRQPVWTETTRLLKLP